MENEKDIKRENLCCREILNLKEKFYSQYGKKPRISEAIIFSWLQYNLGKGSGTASNRNLILKSETKFPAEFGNQTLDISILEGNEIKLGISIKMSTSTSAYLDGADFLNPFFNIYRKQFVKDEDEFERRRKEGKRIGVPTLLQDMARIQNLKAIRTHFPSVTIVYSARKTKDTYWIHEFEEMGHTYIFLEEQLDDPFIYVLKEKVPTITDWHIDSF
ncbi:hypothetical protein [Schinkia azotoformans]|uniref:hypothetical protein n=1 Tax=Schinkia azotoformans TaxID=1454 RepID=UPI002DB74BD8|nr:hypothetical protein [Schinkia azotoformans]MEC1759851.1 hypothetical protein [Schinkia azotoformans]